MNFMKDFVKKEKNRLLIGLNISIVFLAVMLIGYVAKNYEFKNTVSIGEAEILTYYSGTTEEAAEGELSSTLYLSDTAPIQKSIGYGSLMNDTTPAGGLITLKIENNWFAFKKGIFAHAKSTLVYDLSEYADYYKHFTTFIGLNSSAASSSNGAIYHFYTSEDNKTWTEVGEGILKKPGENATFIDIPLDGAKYLKLYVDPNGGNGNDHTVFADAKFVVSVENNFVLDSVEDIDSEIKTKYSNQTDITGELEKLILKRSLVNNVGQYTINSFYNENDDNKAVLDWLLDDVDVLRYYILGGAPEGGNYYNSLTQLGRLYRAYKDDFKIQETTKYGTVLGDLYTRMAVALSLTHAQRVALWMQPGAPENQSDAVVRYQIYKDLHKNDKFKVTDSLDITKWFEHYNVENMRWVMNTALDDESILWLNEYIQSKIDENPARAGALLTPHPHMAYVWPNYGNDIYYAEENYDYFNDLFSVNGKKLYDYGITRGTLDHKVYKLWMNFRNKFGTGAVCGGISKTGSNIRTTHGIAAVVIGQPGHAALLYYNEDAQGRGYWGIDNDVSGWTLSEKGERLLLGWGNGSYARGSYQVVYTALAQEALNDYENFEKAEKLVMLAKSYANDPVKQEQLLREALKAQSINFDAWLELINLYNNSTTKTEDDYYNLAEEVAEEMKYFPLPMYHLTNLLKPKITSIENNYKFTLLQARILNEAKNTPNNTEDSYTVYQPSLTRVEANYLLGQIDTSIASFSFDGADASKIVLSSRFDGNGIRWDYSLDGKQTWKEVSFTGEEEHKWQLTREEIERITAENDIYIHIVGVNYDEENLYKIDITEGALPANIFANDLENRIVGVTLGTEWRYSENDSWVSYSVSSPDLTGDKTIQIRQSATGTKLASPVSPTYTFTMDNQPDTRKYIPVSHLSVHGVSTEATSHAGAAANSLDANYNTRWHSAWNGTDTERFISVKLDEPVYLSAVEFVPAGGGNGKIYDGTIYGSMDGENWVELTNLKNITYTNQANTNEDAIKNTKSFDIAEPQKVQYVKIVADRTNGNWFTARAFNFYQDITKNPQPTAGVAYSTTEATNGKVVARLINPSRAITITNNGGSDTYIFDENGSFTFEFVDANGMTGSTTATVTWIDKSIPDADVNYDIDSNKKIVVSLDGITEDVYLLDKNNNKINYIEVANGKVLSVSYLDSNGNINKIIEVDKNGCIDKIIYKNVSSQVPNVATYVTLVTDGVVTGEEYYDAEGNQVTVTDAEKELLKGLQQSISNPLEYTFEESGDYEFKLLDKASNIAFKSIKADYTDDKIFVSDITYNITSWTNKNVEAKINSYIIDENGKTKDTVVLNGSKHTFEENGAFTFQYKDKDDASNYHVVEHKAAVSWIDKVSPTAEVKYTTLENGNVVATVVNESETIIMTNNGASREYVFKKNGNFTFEFEDLAGNTGKVTAHVDSIRENETKVEIVYSTTSPTKDPVTATLVVTGGKITITNNSGKDSYTFEQNGDFTFEYTDALGNHKKITATVTWIAKESDSIDNTTGNDSNGNNTVKPPVYNTKPSTPNELEKPTESDDEIDVIKPDDSSKEEIKPGNKDENREDKDDKKETKKDNLYIIIIILAAITAIISFITIKDRRKNK